MAQIFPRWNPLTSWMRQIEDFQRAASMLFPANQTFQRLPRSSDLAPASQSGCHSGQL